VGGIAQLKPALRLMMSYRLVLQVYVAFNPRFERIWPESKKRFPDYMEQKPAEAKLRSKYSLRLYSWAKKHVKEGTMSISPGGSPEYS
jgi:hypothetical protein